jgi:O-acetyl-ADP-ribose deacetylase (regulator of RNase III)
METVSRQFGRSTVRLLRGDITKIPADAIVNAANSGLRGGGGVDGAIHRAGGPAIMLELDQIRPAGGCPTGSAVATKAGNLPAKHVFHAVGPVWEGGGEGEAELLASCYRTCLQMAEERAAKILSFPSISTGVYGYPVDRAARVALDALCDYLTSTQQTVIDEVVFVLFDDRTFQAYSAALQAPTPGGSSL